MNLNTKISPKNVLEIRPIKSSEYDLFRQIIIDSLFIKESRMDRFSFLSRDMDLSSTRALFVEGRMVSVLRLIPFKVTFGNAVFPMAGISMVATPPEYRRHGYMGHMIKAMLQEMKERGFPLSCLYARSTALYRRFGWDISSNIVEYSFSPDQLQEQPPLTGRIVRFERDDVEKVLSVYEKYAKTKTCEIVRNKNHWKRHVVLPYRHCYFWENAHGEIDGYLVYEVFDQSLPRIKSFGVEVKEFIALNHGARCAIFTFMKRLLPQIQKIVFKMPLTELCLPYFSNLSIEAKLIPGFMARIVDVKKAFEMKQYSSDIAGEVIFEVRDQLLPWNNDRFILEIQGGKARVQRSSKNAQFSCDINTLSQIFCGHLDLVQAREIGKIEMSNAGEIMSLNRFFIELTPCMHDWF